LSISSAVESLALPKAFRARCQAGAKAATLTRRPERLNTLFGRPASISANRYRAVASVRACIGSKSGSRAYCANGSLGVPPAEWLGCGALNPSRQHSQDMRTTVLRLSENCPESSYCTAFHTWESWHYHHVRLRREPRGKSPYARIETVSRRAGQPTVACPKCTALVSPPERLNRALQQVLKEIPPPIVRP
jgi:hypothetical protein